MFKSRTVLSLLAGALSLCSFFSQAETAEFKTGEYRLCNGELADCRQGKSLHENESYYFEKNHTGRILFRAERTGFFWEVMGDRLEISLDDGSKMAMTVRENSALLDDPKSGTFVLTLDEDASFIPGLYYLCPENSDTSCFASLDAFTSSFPAPDGETSPTFLMLYQQSEYSQICPKGEKECQPLTWMLSADNKQIVATIKGQKITLRIDRNMLINDATGERYLRAYSEAIMAAAS